MTPPSGFLDRIRQRPLIFDGAMGTMIYQRGVFLNACYDELCLTRADLIRGIHRDYAEAGAEVLETNTFGANRIKLAPYGLIDQVAAINRAGVRLAREEAGTDRAVAGSVGPCLLPGTPLSDANRPDIEAAFREQVGALAAAGVDLIILETFHDLPELQLAARIAREAGQTVLASYMVRDTTGSESHPEEIMAHALDADPNVDLIGLNCGVGPAQMFHPVRRVLAVTRKPVVAIPNAGGASEVGGRHLYLNSPEYFTEFAKRFIELGVRGVGGCCGTTPDHIRMAVRAIRTMSGVKTFVGVADRARPESVARPPVETIPFAKRSAFAAKLAAGQRVTSVEMLPPRTVGGLPKFLAGVERCRDRGVDVINLPDGPRASARLSVLVTAMILQRETRMECVPHYCCRDRNLIAMQADLLGGWAGGLVNWLFITGDPPKLGDYPDASGVFDLDAIGLARLARNLNSGFDAGGFSIDPPTGMVIGVGANPLAVEPEREISRYREKVDAGAEYAITQPVFDADALLRFLDRVEAAGCRIPVLAGLYPLLSFKNAEFMSQHVPGVVVPEDVLRRMATCTTKEEGMRMGARIAAEIRDRVAGRVAGFQVSAPLGNVTLALEVLDL
ncbi:MAG: hypothetical protein A2498_04820 [Lentisphaerae bacterium RIFOXYC12_FULL_60_16]|nr:MAG: hypothetical protein A2498_04820 [Lentisphaerae bacterium RIFOXYC12_FULL_60_16]OGV77715.1 MAG: hypothetical protein A2340_11045 [Lentisphaerae bacterium RIFOXYB12_FULL_60_10]